MPKICTLFSGSSGNCTYIGFKTGGILVDAGVSTKRIINALKNINVDINSIKAVLVTHTHCDHTCGLKTLTKNYNIPLFASSGTLSDLEARQLVHPNYKGEVIGSTAGVEDFFVTRFSTMHDSPGSSGYRIDLPGGSSAAVCTDLGTVTDEIRGALEGVNALVFESNHDVNMLQKNPNYPHHLKARILSENGHLSNGAAAAELGDFIKGGTTRITLSHLSRENNLPNLAKSTAEAALIAENMVCGSDYLLNVAPPAGGELIVF